MKAPTTNNHTIETRSRLRLWWLLYVRRYRLRGTKKAPRRSLFGQIAYIPTWVVERKR